MSTTHRIIVLGGGYSGIVTAGQLARRIDPATASVTLVTARAVRDERLRWHQLATGQRVVEVPIADALRGSGAELRIGTVTAIDPEARTILLTGGERLGYDSLVVALGSTIDLDSTPGVREHARALTDPASIARTASMLDALPDGARVVVVGGGLTGLELSTEVAESHPGLRVTVASAREPGDWLSAAARRHLAAVFERLGIETVAGRVTRIDEGRVMLEGGVLASELTLWAGGFVPSPVVRASGITVDENGRAVVDRTLRSVSHPDVWVVGDAAAVPGWWGDALKMGCRTAAFMPGSVAASVTAALTGGRARPFGYRYVAECISLGRHDAIVQWLAADGEPHDRILSGRPAVAMKEFIVAGSRLAARHPGPYLPARRARVRAAADREMITA